MIPLSALLGSLMALAVQARAAPGERAPTESAAPTESVALRNVSAPFLAAEFGSSLLLGFVAPDLLTRPQPEGLTCEGAWCGINGFDVAVRRLLVAERPRFAGHASHAFTLGFVPIVAFGGSILGAVQGERGEMALQDAVILLDVWLVATGANSVAKISGRRQRPAFHYGREALTEAAHSPREEFVSFYSGDTTWAFALASGGTTLALLRDHRHAREMAALSGLFALTGGVLRITGDMHWATDVLMGAVTGTAIGVGMPLLLHGRQRAVRVSPSVGEGKTGLLLEGSW